MAEINLSKYGISGATEIVHNPSYDLLLRKRPNRNWKVMRKVRSVNLAQLML